MKLFIFPCAYLPSVDHIHFVHVFFACFLTGLFVLLLLIFESSLYIPDMNPLLDMWLANILSPSVAVLHRVFQREQFKFGVA